MENSMSHARHALAALVFITAVAGHAAQANADAMADQKKVFEKMGMKFDKKPNKCTVFTQSDAERALHGPVAYVPNDVDPTICAWGLVRDSSLGVTVSRETPPLYPPHEGSYGVSHVRHVTGVGKDAYTYYANAGSGGIYTADVLTAKGVTSVTLPEKAGNAATALAIAKSVMNR